LTPSGCWDSCAGREYCRNILPAIYKPEICAYTSDGRYVSENLECQACQRKEAYAVRQGACSCDFVKCRSGEVCRNGECVKK
jgi:hypothetical protein